MPALLGLGPYVLESEIARGATSVVHLARDTRSGGSVALKTIALSRELQGAALEEARARFLREAEAARRLDHPDIVKIVDAGEDGGVAYLAMEPLSGHDLQRHVDPGQLLPAPQVLRIGARIADALAHAHRQGVVHRDIKPGNVIVDAAADRVVVTDFGVARVGDVNHTRTGILLGTPAYMSPEQLVGQPVDGRSDLYALGALLFQLLCGRLPFESAALAALMKQIVNDPAPPLGALRPDLPETLATLLARMLAKDRASRPADGTEIARALRAISAVMASGAVTSEEAPPGSPRGPG